MADSIVHGINGTVGRPIISSYDDVIAQTCKTDWRRAHLSDLKARAHNDLDGRRATRYDVDLKDLRKTGWGIILHEQADRGILVELKSLLDRRRDQVMAKGKIPADRFRGSADPLIYKEGESAHDFLVRYKVMPGGPADPDRLPYYLLLIGGPERIPFRFQYELGAVYAVGRISFDASDAYRSYAAGVVRAEEQPGLPRRAGFFGTRHAGDLATLLSSESLIAELSQKLTGAGNWLVDQPIVGNDATKERIKRLVNGLDAPAFLFTATHGMAFAADDDQQPTDQGALVCADEPPSHPSDSVETRLPYLSGRDISPDATLTGRILFLFACFSAGTPAESDFDNPTMAHAAVLARRPFVADLPKRLLSAPRDGGGALAVIGHVDKAWSSSFLADGQIAWLGEFEDAIRRLFDGFPVGGALEPFRMKYAALGAALLTGTLLGRVLAGRRLSKGDRDHFVQLIAQFNDARNYVVIGDPAVRLGPVPAGSSLGAVG
jgi:hypothetical protein